MSINSINSNNPVQQTSSITPKAPAAAPAATSATRAADRLELSGAGQALKTLKTNDVRADKVASIKAQIENGTYDADG